MRSPRTATKSSPCSPQLKKAQAQQRRPNTAKKRKIPYAAKNKIKNKQIYVKKSIWSILFYERENH